MKKQPIKYLYTTEILEEIIKCKDNPVYFIEKYLYITDESGERIPFKLTAYQVAMVEGYHREKKFILQTERRMGKTVTALAFLLWYALFNTDKTVAIVSHRHRYSKELLYQLRRMYEDIPSWLKPSLYTDNNNMLEFGTFSKIIIGTNSHNSFKGTTINLLYFDEMNTLSPHEQEDWFEAGIIHVMSRYGRIIISSSESPRDCLFNYLMEKSLDENEPSDNMFYGMKLFSK